MAIAQSENPMAIIANYVNAGENRVADIQQWVSQTKEQNRQRAEEDARRLQNEKDLADYNRKAESDEWDREHPGGPPLDPDTVRSQWAILMGAEPDAQKALINQMTIDGTSPSHADFMKTFTKTFMPHTVPGATVTQDIPAAGEAFQGALGGQSVAAVPAAISTPQPSLANEALQSNGYTPQETPSLLSQIAPSQTDDVAPPQMTPPMTQTTQLPDTVVQPAVQYDTVGSQKAAVSAEKNIQNQYDKLQKDVDSGYVTPEEANQRVDYWNTQYAHILSIPLPHLSGKLAPRAVADIHAKNASATLALERVPLIQEQITLAKKRGKNIDAMTALDQLKAHIVIPAQVAALNAMTAERKVNTRKANAILPYMAETAAVGLQIKQDIASGAMSVAQKGKALDAMDTAEMKALQSKPTKFDTPEEEAQWQSDFNALHFSNRAAALQIAQLPTKGQATGQPAHRTAGPQGKRTIAGLVQYLRGLGKDQHYINLAVQNAKKAGLQ